MSGGDLIDPIPGHAFAFHLRSGEFEQVRLCHLEGLEIVDKAPHVMRVVNTAGMSYNAALDAFSESIQFISLAFLKEDNASKHWPRTARVNEAHGLKFAPHCSNRVSEKLGEGDFLIFVVEAVHLDPNREDPRDFVRFKPKPLVPNPCSDACMQLANLDALMTPHWSTERKFAWEWLDVH